MTVSAWHPRPNHESIADEVPRKPATESEPARMQATSDRLDPISAYVAGGGSDAITHATRGVLRGVHDFSTATGQVSDACSACHVPHLQAVQPVDRSGNQAMLELFRLRGQREVFEPGRYMPGASSLICLSCHNGTVASSTIGTSHALISESLEYATARRSFVLRDHPIGIPYPSGQKGYRPIAAIRAEGTVPLPDGRIECISCHDPHNATGVDKMLVMSNRRSALCLACHEK